MPIEIDLVAPGHAGGGFISLPTRAEKSRIKPVIIIPLAHYLAPYKERRQAAGIPVDSEYVYCTR